MSQIKPRKSDETKMQMAFVRKVEILKLQGKIKRFTAIPNSTPTSIQQANINTLMGVRRGLLDFFLIIKDTPIFIEFKIKGGVISEDQKGWITDLKGANIRSEVCYTAEEALKIINEIIDK